MLRYFSPIFLPYDVFSYKGKWKLQVSRKPTPAFLKSTSRSPAATASPGLNLPAEARPPAPSAPPASLPSVAARGP